MMNIIDGSTMKPKLINLLLVLIATPLFSEEADLPKETTELLSKLEKWEVEERNALEEKSFEEKVSGRNHS